MRASSAMVKQNRMITAMIIKIKSASVLFACLLDNARVWLAMRVMFAAFSRAITFASMACLFACLVNHRNIRT